MSLFRRPKKAVVHRRVFSAAADDDDRASDNSDSENSYRNTGSGGGGVNDEPTKTSHDRMKTPPPPNISSKHEKKSKDDKKTTSSSSSSKKTASLLSFGGDEEEDGEVFQVKKSSHSKKVMKMLDKERRRKKNRDKDDPTSMLATGSGSGSSSRSDAHSKRANNGFNNNTATTTTTTTTTKTNACDVVRATSYADATSEQGDGNDDLDTTKKRWPKSSKNSNSNIHTEIRTDDFVLVVKKTEVESNLILNGRAALCAGRDDMSSEDETADDDDSHKHRFRKPDNFKALLESGAIPDAAMIHEARKKRQKARELGDYVSIEDPKPVDNKKGRLIREEAEDDGSEDERVDMSAITGAKELEERREQFYAVQGHGSDDDSDMDMHEWESQQIRKAISGSQLMNAQQEAYSHFLIKDGSNDSAHAASAAVAAAIQVSTKNLLDQAYATSNLSAKSSSLLKSSGQKSEKKTGPRMPREIHEMIKERLNQVHELNESHVAQIQKITNDMNVLAVEELECEQNAPIVAAKFRFYQELKGYVLDLIECFDEKIPKINELERKYIIATVKYANFLIERRRQDVRDQAREITQQKSTNMASMNNAARKEEEQRVQRAAEREGRRTRRRRDRERNETLNTHLDGMSSDDEIPDHEATLYKNQLKQINAEATLVFEDVTDDFSDLSSVLKHFEDWRHRDMSSYKDTYFSLCLPKIVGPMIRLNLLTWNPLERDCKVLEKMEWYETIMRYGFQPNETEAQLLDDPDIRLVPSIMEKIILPKITELIEKSWDPLSSTQTLNLITLIRRMIEHYPSLKPTSKYMKNLFTAILDRMKLSLENDVFIPIFPKQLQEAKTSFFQRQFSSALKLFRNFLSWEGILSDTALKEIAISSLLNRYLLSAIRICAPIDATTKSHIIVNTLPRVWLQQSSIVANLDLFIQFLRSLVSQLDKRNPLHIGAVEKTEQIFETFRLQMTSST